MRKNTTISIIVVIAIVFSVLAFWFFNQAPSVNRPSHSACGIEFKILSCDYNPDTMKANVEIQLIDGDISGFNGRIQNVDQSEKVQGFIADRQLIQMEQGQSRNFQFKFNITSSEPNGPFKIEIDPLDNNQEICLSGAQIPCD